MLFYDCRLTFHDSLFYETRTLGRLYETGRLLHNIALCYALGFAQTTYHHANDVPRYAQELAWLNENGVYVTPARGLEVGYVIHTFKLGEERSAVLMERSNVNIPTYGRAKEIAIGSTFAFGILSEQPLILPQWIRMGLWMSKARLKIEQTVELHYEQTVRSDPVRRYPLNPGDLPPGATAHIYDLVSMRPSNLLENVLIDADAWWVGRDKEQKPVRLPAGLAHRAAQ